MIRGAKKQKLISALKWICILQWPAVLVQFYTFVSLIIILDQSVIMVGYCATFLSLNVAWEIFVLIVMTFLRKNFQSKIIEQQDSLENSHSSIETVVTFSDEPPPYETPPTYKEILNTAAISKPIFTIY